MIYAIIQGFKDFGWNKKNKDISSSKNKAFARLQWITKKRLWSVTPPCRTRLRYFGDI